MSGGKGGDVGVGWLRQKILVSVLFLQKGGQKLQIAQRAWGHLWSQSLWINKTSMHSITEGITQWVEVDYPTDCQIKERPGAKSYVGPKILQYFSLSPPLWKCGIFFSIFYGIIILSLALSIMTELFRILKEYQTKILSKAFWDLSVEWHIGFEIIKQ